MNALWFDMGGILRVAQNDKNKRGRRVAGRIALQVLLSEAKTNKALIETGSGPFVRSTRARHPSPLHCDGGQNIVGAVVRFA